MSKIIGFVLCLLLLSFPTMAASPAGELYIKRIAVLDSYLLREVSKSIYHSEFKEQEVLDVLAEKLIQSYNDGGKTNYDSIAWTCKALGKSGDIRYKKILQTVKENTDNKKIKKFAKKALKMMPEGQANESYEKGIVDLVSIRDNILNNLSPNNNHPPEIAKLEKKLALNIIIYGPEHSSVALNWSCLGMAWYQLGKYDKSKKYTEKALASHLKIFGSEHPYVTQNWNYLAFAWAALGKYEKAIEYEEKVLAFFEKNFGVNHQKTKTSRSIVRALQDKSREVY